eukprot:gnl/TRDRNA2_/TRDRNA2_178555_c0_seq1.p3 gnl/TRDRNA2_/TRDRNA2_178555_c0~~gnl/TRDRNA2_/TRDRNA2_178555_c0_seq1.p3  ORF type:complete len:113 (+),score=1.08 gnl/TRDRNA2_/TRDRNA2_178555_c0_seq1:125-463(+)
MSRSVISILSGCCIGLQPKTWVAMVVKTSRCRFVECLLEAPLGWVGEFRAFHAQLLDDCERGNCAGWPLQEDRGQFRIPFNGYIMRAGGQTDTHSKATQRVRSLSPSLASVR